MSKLSLSTNSNGMLQIEVADEKNEKLNKKYHDIHIQCFIHIHSSSKCEYFPFLQKFNSIL